jgi:hypothetical protein
MGLFDDSDDEKEARRELEKSQREAQAFQEPVKKYA